MLDTGGKPCWEESLVPTSVGIQGSGFHCDSWPVFDLEIVMMVTEAGDSCIFLLFYKSKPES